MALAPEEWRRGPSRIVGERGPVGPPGPIFWIYEFDCSGMSALASLSLYLILDVRYECVREGGALMNQAVLIAVVVIGKPSQDKN
jgi:hypothetical protein